MAVQAAAAVPVKIKTTAGNKESIISMEKIMTDLKKMTASDFSCVKRCLELRSTGTCENTPLEQFLWSKFYNTAYIQLPDAILWIMNTPTECYTIVPAGRKEDLQQNFNQIQQYFRDILGKKMAMYLVDEEAVQMLNLPPEQYIVEEQRRYFDYIYDAGKLRTLSGRAYHKKKNHVNGFLKEYGNRSEFRMLTAVDREEVLAFLRRWEVMRGLQDDYDRDAFEMQGIQYVLEHGEQIPFLMGGVYVDGALEAFSIGSYAEAKKMAVIHIEKANPDIRGLYAYMNQQFLIHAFPTAELVNREDDMGIEGLRQAKLSYQPLYLLKKYVIVEK